MNPPRHGGFWEELPDAASSSKQPGTNLSQKFLEESLTID